MAGANPIGLKKRLLRNRRRAQGNNPTGMFIEQANTLGEIYEYWEWLFAHTYVCPWRMLIIASCKLPRSCTFLYVSLIEQL